MPLFAYIACIVSSRTLLSDCWATATSWQRLHFHAPQGTQSGRGVNPLPVGIHLPCRAVGTDPDLLGGPRAWRGVFSSCILPLRMAKTSPPGPTTRGNHRQPPEVAALQLFKFFTSVSQVMLDNGHLCGRCSACEPHYGHSLCMRVRMRMRMFACVRCQDVSYLSW